jgi:hypothetical protein
MKLPNYIVQEIFCRLVNKTSKVSSSKFMYKGNCPLCGDKRGRLYVKEYNDDHMIYCHNCSESRSFRSFLYKYHPNELKNLKEFFIESMKSGEAFKKEKRIKKVETALSAAAFNKLDYDLRRYAKKKGFSIKAKQEDKEKEKFRKECYLTFKKRMLPMRFVKDLWCFTDGPLKGYCGIPFFDETGKNMLHWQGRRMWIPEKGSDDEKYNPKYKFLKDMGEGIEIENKPIYGLHTVDKSKPVKITEGAPDSESFFNGIATCGATISKTFINKVKSTFPNRIWVPDNFWKDKAGRELSIKLMLMGETCFIMPSDLEQKDANQYIEEHNLPVFPEEIVNTNLYSGKIDMLKLRSIALRLEIEWPEIKNVTY